MKKASVFKLASRFIVCPVSTITAGVGVDSEPYIVLPALISAVELGEAINHALDSSHDGIAHPKLERASSCEIGCCRRQKRGGVSKASRARVFDY